LILTARRRTSGTWKHATLIAIVALCAVASRCGTTGGRATGGAAPETPATDRDGDGLTDSIEAARGTDPDNPDSDGDGLADGDEVAAGTSPLASDSDLDRLPDGDDPNPTRSDSPARPPEPDGEGGDDDQSEEIET
jgi:hypothetical protein